MSAPALAVASDRGALVGLYRPPEVVFVGGEGAWLVDAEGERWLDVTSGIGVTSLGHGSPVVLEALARAAATGLLHTSNLFRTAPAERLAALLRERAGWGRAFFCNSGAEAGEAAFKFARKWARTTSGEGRTGFVAFRGAFHGRLFGTLAATDRASYRTPFEPLMPGVRFCDPADPAALDAAIGPDVAAVVIEPIQGEGGVRPVPAGTLRRLRSLCDERGALLVFDEVQCGLGRTGRLFAHEEAGVRPDLLVLAKPLAGGLPMGAVLASDAVADTLAPGDHGTTFGGGPLVATVAEAVVARLSEPAFLAGVRERAALLEAGLRDLASRRDEVVEVRGRGMMWGVEVAGSAADVVERARDRRVLFCTAGAETVRLLPPLVVDEAEIDQALDALEASL